MTILNIEAVKPEEAQTSLKIFADGDDYEELKSMATRNKVLSFARQTGFQGAGLNGVPTPYPIDENNEFDDDLVMGKRAFKCWRAEYVVQAVVGLR